MDEVHGSEDQRGAESEANVDIGPMEAEDCTRLGPAGSEVRSEYKMGLAMTRVKACSQSWGQSCCGEQWRSEEEVGCGHGARIGSA